MYVVVNALVQYAFDAAAMETALEQRPGTSERRISRTEILNSSAFTGITSFCLHTAPVL